MALDTNWFVSGDSYICSYEGNDGNAGTQALPKKTIKASNLIAGDNIIRSGVYYPIDTVLTLPNGANLIGDSENVFIYGSATTLQDIQTTNNTKWKNIRVQNVINILKPNTNSSALFEDCWFQDITELKTESNNSSEAIRRTLFKNVTTLAYETNTTTFINHFIGCTFINCKFKGFLRDSITFIDCYFENCNFESSNATIQTATFQRCVFDQSSRNFGTVGALDGDLFKDIFTTNSISETTLSTSINKGTFNTTYGTSNTCAFNSCYWVDTSNPTKIFNDAANDDYTLYTDGQGTVSVLHNGGFPIGKFGLSLPFNSQSPAFVNGTRNNVTLNPTGTFDLDIGATEGFVQSASIGSGNGIEIPFAILLTDAIRFIGQTFVSPAGAKQVVDQTINDIGSNVRYTFWLKYKDPTTGNIMPNDNQTVNAADWYEIEHGNIFGVEITNAGNGNGNVNVVVVDLSPIRAKEFQVRFTIRNNGN